MIERLKELILDYLEDPELPASDLDRLEDIPEWDSLEMIGFLTELENLSGHKFSLNERIQLTSTETLDEIAELLEGYGLSAEDFG